MMNAKSSLLLVTNSYARKYARVRVVIKTISLLNFVTRMELTAKTTVMLQYAEKLKRLPMIALSLVEVVKNSKPSALSGRQLVKRIVKPLYSRLVTCRTVQRNNDFNVCLNFWLLILFVHIIEFIQKVCTCKSTNKNNLVAQKCNLDGSNCGVACDTSVCGAFTVWTEWSTCTVTCGGGTKTRNRCFNWADNSANQCETETENCNELSCPKLCTCQNTDRNNLSARLCNLDGTNCGDDCDASVCGETKTTIDDCSVTCGGGQQLAVTTFVWAETGQEEFVTAVQQACNMQDCPKESFNINLIKLTKFYGFPI